MIDCDKDFFDLFHKLSSGYIVKNKIEKLISSQTAFFLQFPEKVLAWIWHKLQSECEGDLPSCRNFL